jgi:homoaconitase/3-isopropylmalate dehydratase large subunit
MEPVATVQYKPDQVKKLKDLGNIAINQVYIGS